MIMGHSCWHPRGRRGQQEFTKAYDMLNQDVALGRACTDSARSRGRPAC